MGIISVEEAIEKIISVTVPIEEQETVSLWEIGGRILAEDIRAKYPQPPFSRSPLDGYALRAADTTSASRKNPVQLTVIDKVMAGDCTDKEVLPKTAVRIMTGAPIPAGADCVIRQEDTDYGEEIVSIYQQLSSHENICDRGEDYPAGSLLMKKGEKADALAAGIIASAGKEQVLVYRKPRIALFTSGDELASPGEALWPGKLYNSNLYLIYSRLEELGFSPIRYGHITDDVEKMAEMIETAAREADLILTTGGVSVGQKDIMHDVVTYLDAERLFWRIAIKPGSPVLAYRYGNTPVLALSGNPFGALVTFEMLARPVIAHLSRDKEAAMKKVAARVQEDFPKPSPARRIVRGIWQPGKVEIPKQGHASGILASMKGCNCLVDIQNRKDGLKEGEWADVWLL